MATTTITQGVNGSYSWICPPSVTSATVKLWGGGGAGGGVVSTTGGGGGGGGGEFAQSTLTVTPGTTYPYTVGVGGSGTTGDGGNGGSSTFNTNVVVAMGGLGGKNKNNGGTGGRGDAAGYAGQIVYAGGVGGNSSGTTYSGGGGGGAGTTGVGGSTANNTAGTGTSLSGGNGAAGKTTSANGGAGTAAGGGGSGSLRTATGSNNGGGGATGRAEISFTTPLTSAITDDFTDGTIDAAKWTVGNSTRTTETSGTLQTTTLTSTGYYTVNSIAAFDLTGSTCFSKVVNAGDQTLNSLEVYPVELRVLLGDANNRVLWLISRNVGMCYKTVTGVGTQVGGNLTYDSSVHKYFRIRESGGTTYWDWSMDGINWTNHTSTANPITVTSLYVYTEVGTYAVEASGTTVQIDDFNIEGTPVTYTPKNLGLLGVG